MSPQIVVIASDAVTQERLAASIPTDAFTVTLCAPDELPATWPQLFVIALPALGTDEEALIEKLRADETTTNIPIVIVTALSLVQLQSMPYASDWTVAIVSEPVDPQVLLETMRFLLNPE